MAPAGTLRGDTADAQQRPTVPDAGPLLDEAFGPGQG
jgi:hypothetical protein